MKSTFISNLFAFTVISLSNNCLAQQTASASATVSASIVTPITIFKNADLLFGNIKVSTKIGGTTIISPSGLHTASGGVTSSGTHGAASFTVSEQDNYTYGVTLPTTATINELNPNLITVSDFTSAPSDLGTIHSGSQNISVGATLNLKAAESNDTYTGSASFIVAVNYN